MKQINCSFCGRSRTEVRILVPGPGGIWICNSCIDVAKSVSDKELGVVSTKEFEDRVAQLRALLQKRDITPIEYKTKRKQLLEQLWKT